MWMRTDDDGIGMIGMDLPTEVADAIWERLTTIASSSAYDDDPRTMDQRRADLFAALLLGISDDDAARLNT
jgi:hypothetical protein